MKKVILNRIFNKDCIDMLSEIPDKSIDMIFADPPYNLQLKDTLLRPDQTVVEAVNEEWDKFKSYKEYDDFTCKWLKQCKRVLKDGGAFLVI